jgi:hypothetical protein
MVGRRVDDLATARRNAQTIPVLVDSSPLAAAPVSGRMGPATALRGARPEQAVHPEAVATPVVLDAE